MRTLLFIATLCFSGLLNAGEWRSYDRYLQHGWQHKAPHVVPHIKPHMHSNPSPDALAYPFYEQRQRERVNYISEHDSLLLEDW